MPHQAEMHTPVLAHRVVELLAPRPGDIIVDATVGTGGHSRRLIEAAAGPVHLIGLDLDPAMLERARQTLAALPARLDLLQANFADLRDLIAGRAPDGVDIILADLGVASPQLDDPQRGLSFQRSGPLDMRLDPAAPRTAADLLNRLPERDLADLLHRYGEERAARRIARQIVRQRQRAPLRTTDDLVEAVCRALRVHPHARRYRIHPATRVFQALRIAVNDELENLRRFLHAAPQCLRPGGRIAVIAFHSLEDRLVKHAFVSAARAGIYQILTPKPIRPDDGEKRANPRSRSARLRAARRLPAND